ncbi:MAG: hypothetical protein J6U96_00615, partial [Elusimicrobiaceae bacterium]|nr:hypothetical protein [Elusimicrobiaceae bacterium]
KWVMPWRITYLIMSAIGGGLGTAFSLHWKIAPDAFSIGISTRFVWALVVFMLTLMTLPNLYMIWRIRHKLAQETKRHLLRDIK